MDDTFEIALNPTRAIGKLTATTTVSGKIAERALAAQPAERPAWLAQHFEDMLGPRSEGDNEPVVTVSIAPSVYGGIEREHERRASCPFRPLY